ncbi:TetR/AcrR family transcriptional regulator [Thermogemmatispora carboxidivorans]|uniref:TetR/AcrR family transcriptional regulator n=1 Tax=Thermogemmatispora carboxidivorans TaxID=1382306 RepID=UPI0006996782|nr:TetR/AcrR family transcriptional regulator [Thermogemmatispora carboxidivorans]
MSTAEGQPLGESAGGHVDPRVRRTRRLLQQALLELLQEKSFADISIQDIAERATVNRTTFYAHFGDKYALADAVIHERFLEAVTSKLPATPGWQLESLRLLISAVFEFLGGLHEYCSPAGGQFDPLMERAVQQELARILLQWLRQAPASSSAHRWSSRPVPLETLAEVMSWAIFGCAAQWSKREEGKLTAGEMSELVLRILVEGTRRLVPGLEE